ncbi:MAG: tetratricopeptide repeat protein [Salinivirgaceae bacterium]|nr:tetratricopeptide repeat protein [Salinivirgaceae bacterium]
MNKLKTTFLTICALLATNLNAQDAKDLKQKLQRTSDKSEQITILHKLGENSLKANATAEAIGFHKHAWQLSCETGDTANIVKSLNYIGAIYWRTTNYDSAQYYYLIALEACNDNYTEDKARILNNLALSNQSRGNYQEAEKYYNEALRNWQKTSNERELASTFNRIGSMYLSRNMFDSALVQYNKAMTLRAKLKDTAAIAMTFNNIATLYKNQKQFDSALVNMQKSIELLSVINDREGLAEGYNNLGGLYWQNKMYKESLANYLLALDLRTAAGNTDKIAATTSNIGLIYKDLKNYDKALEYYNRSLEQYKLTDNLYMQAEALNLIGGVYWQSGKYREACNVYANVLQMHQTVGDRKYIARSHNNLALAYKNLNVRDSALAQYNLALDIYREIGDKINEAAIINNIGNLHLKFGDNEAAIQNLSEALNLRRQAGTQIGIAYSELDLGRLYANNNLNKKAMPLLNDALQIAENIKNIELKTDILLLLSNIYASEGKHLLSYNLLKDYITLKDSILDNESVKRIAEMQISYETEKKEQELKIKDIQILQEQERNSRQRIIIYFAITVLLVVLIFAAIVIRKNKRIRKANEMLDEQNRQIIMQNEEIEQQRDYVTMQRDQIAEQKEKITDSIEYASRIQTAMLPPENTCNELLPKHFIMLKPRDIVSGDFYWIKKVGGRVIATAVDCTGHGVPGAFMSMLGSTLLEQITANGQFNNAADILEQMRESVKTALHQDDTHKSQSDGMDCSLCIIDFERHALQYAGANNPLIIVRNGELIEIEADRMPVGIHVFEEEPFKNNDFELRDGDKLYMFSDGFADQFGGETGRKLMMKNFKKLLLDTSNEPITEQKELLNQKFNEWKGEYRQIDDVLVIGIEI